MALGTSPVVRRRRLAIELRRLRAAAGKTLEEVADYLECSPAKVSRIENGQVGARIQDVRDMLDCYDVQTGERENLLSLVRQSREKGWWHKYADLLSEEFQTYIGLEDEASTIWTYETHLVPGLFQTENYARAVMTGRRDASIAEVERGMRIRRTRQEILNRDRPPELGAVIDESVLRWLIGNPDLMTEQYDRLVSVASRPTVTLQVLPFTAGIQAGGGYPFTILGFDDPADPRVAYAELLTSGYNIDHAEDVGRYYSEFERLRSYALTPDESIDHITALASRGARATSLH